MLEQPGEVVVADYGSFVGKKSERLVVKKEGRIVLEVPFYDLRSLVIETSGASISTDCIMECARRGISIGFLTSDGKPCATLVSPYLTGTVITRRAQYEAYKDRRGVQLVKHFVTGKLKNQLNTLRYFAKYRKAVDGELYDAIQFLLVRMDPLVEELAAIDGRCIEDVRGQIMSVEGRAGHLYWQGIKLLLGGRVDFPGREHAGATDPVNSLLNYGYAILYGKIEKCLLLAGLDPYAGFLHVDRAGKESLVYDFVVEQKINGTFLGLSAHLSVDACLLAEQIVLELKFGERKKFHHLQTTAYALAMEVVYEFPVNLGCIVYARFKNGRLFVERDLHIIDDELRQWFIEERDAKMRLVEEAIDPGVQQCYETCPYYGHCC